MKRRMVFAVALGALIGRKAAAEPPRFARGGVFPVGHVGRLGIIGEAGPEAVFRS